MRGSVITAAKDRFFFANSQSKIQRKDHPFYDAGPGLLLKISQALFPALPDDWRAFRNLAAKAPGMSNPEPNSRLKRLRNHYRLVIMNEDTYEEVVRFKLTRLGVYSIMSTLFILMVALTVSLIIFTPLKYYLPGVGYGNARQVKEYRALKLRTDSMEKALLHQQQFLDDIQKVLKGNVKPLDTNMLKLPKAEISIQ